MTYRRPLTLILVALLTLGLAGTASAKTYIPKKGHACKAGYVQKTIVKRELKGKRSHRHWEKVKVRECVSKPKTTTTTTALAAPTVRASIDPSYTQNTADPLVVTWAYDAGVDNGTLPDGTLALTVYEAGQVASAGGCTIDVDSTTTGGDCTQLLPQYGTYNVTVTYTSSSSTVAPSTATDTETIEPLPVTNLYDWGTDSPTQDVAIQTTLIGQTATVTVTDPSFEGATSIGLTDSTGATCTADVTGTTATCTITDTSTPTSYVISYPGGTSTTSSQNVANNGVQQVTDEWLPDTYTVADPSVTIPAVTIGHMALQQLVGIPGQPLETGAPVGLDPTVSGNLPSDPDPAGTLSYTITAANPADDSGWAEQSYDGGWAFWFWEPDTYTIKVTFTSADPNYPDATASVTVNVIEQ